MLIASLVLTALMMGLILEYVRLREKPLSAVLWTLLVFLVIGAYPRVLMLFPHVLSGLLVGVLALLLLYRTPQARLFVQFSLVACVVAYLTCTAWVVRDIYQLRQAFPVESVVERIHPPGAQTEPLSTESQTFLAQGTGRQPDLKNAASSRDEWLSAVHEGSVNFFINQSGFGVARMPPTFQDFRFEVRMKTETIPQPQSVTYPNRPTDTAGKGGEDYRELLRKSLDEFIDPGTFGLFRARDRVIGFRPHRFEGTPPSLKGYRLQRIDLLGLVVAPEPRVYVTDNLPRMQDLRHGPTRELDTFESAGLAALGKGELLYTEETEGVLKVLGAIRSVEQCNACHAAQTGDLLGAFSYRLQRQP